MKNFLRRLCVVVLTLAMCLPTLPMTAYAAAGDPPAHSKSVTANSDGSFTIALDVTGDSEKKVTKANVIVVFDTSSSMNSNSGTSVLTYTATNTNGNNLYGTFAADPDLHSDDDFFSLNRHGNGGNRFYTYDSDGSYAYRENTGEDAYYGIVNGEYVLLTRSGSGNYFNPYAWSYNGQSYTGTRYIRYEDEAQYTGQRYTRNWANQSRLQAAKAAVNDLASALLANNGGDNPSDVSSKIPLPEREAVFAVYRKPRA